LVSVVCGFLLFLLLLLLLTRSDLDPTTVALKDDSGLQRLQIYSIFGSWQCPSLRA
jgi:hypothetical protein